MDTATLTARFEDAVNICKNRDIPKFLGFLSESESGYLGLLAKRQNINMQFFGGFTGAERTYAGFFPSRFDQDDTKCLYPVSALSFTFRNCDSVTHRDVLGSLMALGIERDTIGDILTEPGRAVVFLNEKIAKLAINSITKFGRVGVTVMEGYSLPLPSSGKTQEFTVTVASERLDAVVSAIANISRTVACGLIESGAVVLNSVTAQKATTRVQSPAVISVRRYGKFNIDDIGGCTKKGRMIIKGTKYI